ncbi:MAG: hypothetical protein JNL30_16510 [Rubrivivax sp.]|nr:hypothetical protein [Rubrivivax sp.]
MNLRGRVAALAAMAALLATSGAAVAQAAADRPVRGFVGIGLAGGGDKLATVQWSNGDTTNIKAGGLVDFRVGADVRLGESPFSLLASVGWFSDSANGNNGSVRFERYPLELMGSWRLAEGYRLGLGVRNPGDGKLKGRGAASNLGTTTFKGELGYVLEGEWLFGRSWGVALRYVGEEYKAPNGQKVDGSHVGLRGAFYF